MLGTASKNAGRTSTMAESGSGGMFCFPWPQTPLTISYRAMYSPVPSPRAAAIAYAPQHSVGGCAKVRSPRSIVGVCVWAGNALFERDSRSELGGGDANPWPILVWLLPFSLRGALPLRILAGVWQSAADYRFCGPGASYARLRCHSIFPGSSAHQTESSPGAQSPGYPTLAPLTWIGITRGVSTSLDFSAPTWQ